MRKLVQGVLAALSAAVMLSGAGCGPDCGKGTEEVAGECVPVCGDGAARDAQTGECEAVCGAGTVYDQTLDACLTDNAACPTGLVFDVGAAKCVLPHAATLEGDEPNDPTRFGTPTPVTLPAENGTVMVGGNIDAPGEDADDDGYPDEDIDAFSFTATKGQTLLIEATGGGLPSPVVWIANEDKFISDTPTSVSDVRNAVGADNRNPTRKIRILETGTYYLLVTDKDNVFGSYTTGGAGNDYVVAISIVPTPPDGTVATGGSFTASFDEPKAFAITGFAEGDILQMDPGALQGLLRYIYVLDGTDSVLGAYRDVNSLFGAISMGAQRFKATSATLKLFFDYQLNLGGEPPTVNVTKLSVAGLGNASSSVPVHSTGHAITSKTQIDVYSFQYQAPTGTAAHGVARIAADNRNADWKAKIVILDASYKKIGRGSNVVYFDWTANADYYIEVSYGATWAAGTYNYDLNIDVTETTHVVAEGSAANDDAATATALTYAPLPGVVTPAALNADDLDYYTFTPAAADTVIITAYSPTGGDLAIALLDAAEDEVASADALFEYDSETIIKPLTAGAKYYVTVEEYYGDPADYVLIITK